MLMYTKYTSLLYFNYLTLCVSYTSSVRLIMYIRFPVVSCMFNKSFIDTLCLDKKLLKLKTHRTKVVKFCVHINTVFSCRVTNTSCMRQENWDDLQL